MLRKHDLVSVLQLDLVSYLSFFLFSDQEKLVTNLGSDNQEARKEIISLKEQVASTSQVIISNLQGKRKLI